MPGYDKHITHIIPSLPGKEILLQFIIIIPILQVRKLRYMKLRYIKWLSRHSNTDVSDLEACTLSHSTVLLPRALAGTL